MPALDLDTELDTDLAAERAHLDRLPGGAAPDAGAGRGLFATGDKVAGDAYAAETLGRTLARRVAELADDPTTPLFFGRLDFEATEPDDDHAGHGDFHIGRRHVTDDAGEPMVLDWRAPLSRGRSTRPAPATRRASRSGAGSASSAAQLTSFEDEHLDRGEELGTDQPRSSPPRSSGPASGRCATSSPPSSPSRTTWSGPTWTTRSACRARPAPARRRSACTGPRTCSTCTGSGCAGRAC